jgi:hypothetical protein
MNDINPPTRPLARISRQRTRFGLAVLVIGMLIFVFGANPGLINMDRSPITGFLQIVVFIGGLGLLCLGGYLALTALWAGREKSIAADIGPRLVATGYVISVASGMSDLLGFGTHLYPNIPYFGPWQALGVMIGEAIISFGFVLMIPHPNPKS